MTIDNVLTTATATLSLLFIIILLIIVSPLYLFRWFLLKLGHWKHGFGSILSSHSAIFYYPNIETIPSHNLGIALEVSGLLNPERLINLLSNRMVFLKNTSGNFVYPEFQQAVVTWFGFPFWKWENKFEIQEHIHFFPKAKDPVSNVDAFKKAMEFLAEGFRSDKSPWKIIAIEKESSYLLLFKFHHTLADGYAIFKALMNCCDVPSEIIRPLSKKLNWKNYLQECLSLVNSFFPSAHPTMTTTITHGLRKETAWDIPSFKMMSERMYCRTAPIPMARAKELSRRTGLSLSSVILSGIAGAIRKYMMKGHAQEGTGLLCSFPLPAPNHPEGLTNYLMWADIELPLVDEEPEFRSQHIQEIFKQKMMERNPEKINLLCTLLGSLPYVLKEKMLKPFPPMCCSIFPGPKEQISFDNSSIVDMYFTLNAAYVYSCLVSVLSYNGCFHILIHMDKNICQGQEDAEKMTKFVEEEFRGLDG